MTNTNRVKSGYARDVMPGNIDADEARGLAVPIADDNGRQEGRLSPAEREYGKASYKVVSLEEAEQLTHMRTIGKAPQIRGGLTDNTPKQEPEPKGKKMKAAKVGTRMVKNAQVVNKDFDPLGDGDFEPGDPRLVAEEEAMARQVQQPAPFQGSEPAEHRYQAPTPPSPIELYLAKRIRVTLELVDGAMSMSAVDVKQSKYGVTVLIAMNNEGSTFIPKPGSEITVVCGENRWPCFFPGTYFEIDELKLMGLVFVKAEG